MILWRVLPWDRAAAPDAPGGATWFPRPFQGVGRHDNPEQYGCLYLAEEPVSCLAEALAPFRGSGAEVGDLLRRGGRPLSLARLELAPSVRLLDLDDPAVLVDAGLRPSQVATGDRTRTQRDAGTLHARHRRLGGLRWWSTLEASWANVTLFDRTSARLTVAEVTPLSAGDGAVTQAARFLGLATATAG